MSHGTPYPFTSFILKSQSFVAFAESDASFETGNGPNSEFGFPGCVVRKRPPFPCNEVDFTMWTKQSPPCSTVAATPTIPVITLKAELKNLLWFLKSPVVGMSPGEKQLQVTFDPLAARRLCISKVKNTLQSLESL
mmetsp:Transcript_10505/g.13645  ORF Transcript_10505/g.13645 Transcript_10505/m.13645 type:complete len:136 (-) Transcript_10505:820-1227(-)